MPRRQMTRLRRRRLPKIWIWAGFAGGLSVGAVGAAAITALAEDDRPPALAAADFRAMLDDYLAEEGYVPELQPADEVPPLGELPSGDLPSGESPSGELPPPGPLPADPVPVPPDLIAPVRDREIPLALPPDLIDPIGSLATPVVAAATEPVSALAAPVAALAEPVSALAAPVAALAEPVSALAEPVVAATAEPVSALAEPVVGAAAEPVSTLAAPLAAAAEPMFAAEAAPAEATVLQEPMTTDSGAILAKPMAAEPVAAAGPAPEPEIAEPGPAVVESYEIVEVAPVVKEEPKAEPATLIEGDLGSAETVSVLEEADSGE